jgi:hypothetical protein
LVVDPSEPKQNTTTPSFVSIDLDRKLIAEFTPASAASSACSRFATLRATLRSMLMDCIKATTMVERTTRTRRVVTREEAVREA